MNPFAPRVRPLISAIILTAALCAAPRYANAGLGGDVTSIQSDALAMSARAMPAASAESATTPGPTANQAQATSNYTARSFVTERGVTVREYAAQSGPVFGVAWQGRRAPDLSVLLGSYYPEYTSAVAAHSGHFGLHHGVIAGPDMIVVMSGHMGSLRGRAYVPKLAPSGVDPQAVVK
jgi:hypothetical protein